jgi:hypothetical protein
MIRLRHVQTFYGPNLFSTNPVLAVLVSADDGQLPFLQENIGLVSGHLGFEPEQAADSAEYGVEDLAKSVLRLAASLLNRLGGTIDDFQIAPTTRTPIIASGYYLPAVSLSALQLTAQLINNARDLSATKIAELQDDFLEQGKRFHPDSQAEILLAFAKLRNIPFLPYVPNTPTWQFGWGRRSKPFFESLSNSDGAVAHLLAADRTSNRATFAALGLPTPQHVLANDLADAVKAAETIGFPCVVKTIDRGGDKGISATVRDDGELREAFARARTFGTAAIMIEQRVEGAEHRLLAVGGEFACAVVRQPPGPATDVTDRVHPELRAMVGQLARTIGVGMAGFDYVTPDIAASPRDSGGAFIEMATMPDLDLCLAANVPLDPILEKALGAVGRIPAELIITSPDDAKTASEDAGRGAAALVAGPDIHIGGCRYRVADADGWNAVQAALRNRNAESLVIVADRNEITLRGLPLDRFDRIVVTDAGFPENWLPVLRRCSPQVEISTT